MFTHVKSEFVDIEKNRVDAVCLSTDTKPTTGIANGSLVLELDTNKIYYFDETSSTWAELGTEPSGNSSSLPDTAIGDGPIY